ncbi:hypothetical protein KPL71_001016 [Citrus sinensis]|uniref:Uncharacterized protein n=1 Tax=Citrus sinensis TaxID=2711 RepID=A0ACB8NUI7_CITSI|nr:hypothetical protein KPL71_001016 [Citrus sinensis]
MLQSKIPQKLKDLESFTISYSIRTKYNGKTLCDLGASINLMPLSVFKQLGVGEVRPTTVTLQLADRSHAYPEGKIEDVLVKVDKFIFLVDFIVLDFEVIMSLLNVVTCAKEQGTYLKSILTNILEVELFDVWGIDFIGPFPPSFGNLYILVTVDYVFKWVEAIVLSINDAKAVVKFLQKNFFTRFETPRAIINDYDTHFCNRTFTATFAKYGIKHKIATTYHPQSNDRTAYKTPLGISPYKIIYGKAYHLPLELEHKTYWALKRLNMDMHAAVEHRKFQLYELEELRLFS